MQIRKINHYVIIAYLAMTAANVGGFIEFGHLRGQAQKAVERQRLATAEADRMIAGSKFLTNSVRAFAATGDVQHEKAYWDEVKVTRSRDHAEAALREMGLTNDEIDLIERAKGNSDKLIELEDQAFKVGAQGNRTRAIELVFGEDYRKALATIYAPVEKFRTRLDTRLADDVAAVEQTALGWWYASLTLAAINTLLVIFILGVLYRRRVAEPLARLNTEVQNMLDGRPAEDDPSRFAHTVDEIGALVSSFTVLRETHRKAEDMGWIKTHTAEIGNALQVAEDFRTLAQAAVSKLAPVIGAGHGAFYVRDADDSFSLIASYGFRERKGISNHYRIGEGLVGQCAIERIPILIDAPQDYIRISSGLGEGTPACIIVLPIVHGERVLGVLEMASFHQFNERERALLDALQPLLSTSMEILDRNLKTRELLTATQDQAERMEKQAAQLEEQTVEMEAQQSELMETENWFRSIIDTAPDGVLVVDDNGQVVLSNPVADELFGHEAGDLVGKSIESLVPIAARSGHSKLREQFVSEGRTRMMAANGPVTGLRKDGSEFPIAVSLSPLSSRGGRGRCVAASVRRINS